MNKLLSMELKRAAKSPILWLGVSYLWMRKDLIAIIALRIIRLMKTLSKRPLIMLFEWSKTLNLNFYDSFFVFS